MDTDSTNTSSTTASPLTPRARKQASYGALISITIIMAIVIVGAYYAWSKRIAENTIPATPPQQSY